MNIMDIRRPGLRNIIIKKTGRSVVYVKTIAEAVLETENHSKGNSAKTGTLGSADSPAEIKGLRHFHPRDRHHTM